MKAKIKNEYLINQKKISRQTSKEKIQYPNNVETIIVIMVNKIISNAMNEIRRKEILEKMKIYCYDFIKNNVNLCLKSNFFTYDNDLDTNKEKIFIDFKPEKFDTKFDIIPEPLIPERDRNNSNRIKVINENKTFIVNKVFEPIESKKSSLNELIEIDNLLQIKKDENKILEESKTQLENKTDNIILNNENNSKLIDKNSIINFPCTDLEEEKYTNKYIEQNKNNEFNKLRKEIEKEINIRNIEKQLAKKQQKKVRKALNLLNQKKTKKIRDFNSDNFSFDSQGNIIKKRLISIEFFNRDFSFAKLLVHKNNKIKKTKLGQIEIIKNNEKNDMTKNNILQQSEGVNLQLEKNKIIIDEINKKKLENKTSLARRKSILLNIESNPKDSEDIYQNPNYKKFNENIKEIILYNSSNDNLVPEPGVILKTDIMKKTGGKNFFRKYNRPSMKEFNNFILNLSNSLPNSGQEMVKSTESTKLGINLNSHEKIYDTNESNVKYNGYNQKFEDNNPLIKGANVIMSKGEVKFKKLNPNYKYIDRKIKLKKMNGNKTRILSNYKFKNEKWRINNFSDSMILSNNAQSTNNGNFDNLYNYLGERSSYKNFDYSSEASNIKDNYKINSLNDILKNTIHERIIYKKLFLSTIKDKNIKKNDFNNNNGLINSIDKFNLKILKDVNFDIWGNDSENILNNSELHAKNKIKPFSLFKKLNLSKIENKRERKNIVDIIKNNKSFRNKNLFKLDSNNNYNFS